MLKEELQNTLRQTDELKARNRELEPWKIDTVSVKHKVGKYMMVGDLIDMI